MTPLRLVSAALAWVAVLAAGGAGTVARPPPAGPFRAATAQFDSVAAPAYGTYSWPVTGPVIQTFEAPATPYSSGHRGIDIGAPFGSTLVAAGDGQVAFAGWVAGSQFVSIDHPDGVRTTYSWLSSVTVAEGQPVARGEVIGATGQGHPELAEPHLHFGARVGTTYIDPMLLLEGGSVAGLIHLAPL
jgi:murein DD-endopeptidase MepM/ murein hydrolase activator NlpD